MRKILTIRVPLCAGGSIASGAAAVGVLMEQIIALVARIFSLGVRFAPRSAGGSMLRANRRGAGEGRRPRRASEKMPEMTPGSANTSPDTAKISAGAQCHPHTVMV